MNLKNINKNLQDINDIINSVDIGLLKNNDQHIHRKFHNIQKRLIINEIELDKYEFSNNIKLSNERKKILNIKSKLNNILKYYNIISSYKQRDSLHLLSLVSLIFLPLGTIVGYFGMNFINMRKSFSVKNPHKFVFSLFIIYAIITTIIFYTIQYYE